jgi:uncharacterized repeat protein (TIGR01451 family)
VTIEGPPILDITKTVTPTTGVTYQGEVTYTITLSNSGQSEAANTLLTDTLPVEVDFVRWIDQPAGADASGDQLTWNGSVPAGEELSFIFVGRHIGDFGDVVTNQADFSHSSGNGSATATFTVELDPPPPPPPPPPASPSIIYLPLVNKNFATFVDLIVEELVVSSTGVTVTVKNVGNAPVEDAFWVDLYIDPDPPPTGVNQQWQDLSIQGVAWGVTDPLPANTSLTLTLGDQYFVPAESNFVPVPPGTPVYAQVDSINFDTSYGNVLESDESNNILGPESSVAGAAGQGVSTGSRGSNGARQKLPVRKQ